LRPTKETDQRVREALPERAPSDRCPSEERWVDLLLGDLEAGQAEALRTHLESCAACAKAAGEAQKFLAVFSDQNVAPARFGARRWALLVAAATVVMVFGVVLTSRRQPVVSLSAVERFAAAIEVPLPEGALADPVESELVYREGDIGGRSASLAGALVPYRERRYAEACAALADHASRYFADRETRYLAAVACVEAGALDRADALLASLAATAGERRDDAHELLVGLRRARSEDGP